MKTITKQIGIFFTMSLITFSSYAYDFGVDGIYYKKNSNNTVSVTYRNAIDKYSGSVNIPSQVTYDGITYTVTAIGAEAFKDCIDLTSVTIPNSVTTIETYAFNGCRELKSITIPNSVTIIGSYSFGACRKITSIIIPNSVTAIHQCAFYWCSALKSIVFGSGLTYVCYNAFDHTSIAKAIWLPSKSPVHSTQCKYITASVHYVPNDQYEFSNQVKYPFLSSMFTVNGTVFVPVSPSEHTCDVIDCTYSPEDKAINITDKVTNKGVELNVRNINPYSYSGNPYIETATINYSGTIGDNAFRNCVSLQSVTASNGGSIGNYAFSDCTALTTASISNGGSIGNYAFSGCSSLTTASIDNGSSIGKSAFSDCSALTTATLGKKVTGIGASAFYKCTSLAKFEIPNTVTYVGNSAFDGCSSLKTITIGTGITTLPYRLFQNCISLDALSIPNNVASIDSNVFTGCSALRDLTIKDGEEELNLNTVLFSDCPLDKVYIGRKLNYSAVNSPFYRNKSLRVVEITDAETQIYDNEFEGCSNLQTLKLGNRVKTIGKYAFSGCSSLQSFSVGSAVEKIGQAAFSNCSNLKNFYSYSLVPPVCGDQALDDINKWECTLYVPEACVSAYQAADQWKEFFFILGGSSVLIDTNANVAFEGRKLRCGSVYTNVYNLSGTKIYSGFGDVELNPGTYIIIIDGRRTIKVVVK